jgi:hypothetical protein
MPVRGKGHGGNHIGVALKGGARLPARDIPQLDGLIRAGRGQGAPIGGEGQGGNRIGMAQECGSLSLGETVKESPCEIAEFDRALGDVV